MRVNARLDEATQQQLEYLMQATGQSVSHVVRESVAQYYVQVKRQQVPSRYLALAGQWGNKRSGAVSNPVATSNDVKALYTEALRAKYPQHFESSPHLGTAPATASAPAPPAAPRSKARR